ncbi:MAG: type VI secretion system tube protein Hcp [Terriglobia bacterium]|jgi:type VI secretion system secreted protein Hcp
MAFDAYMSIKGTKQGQFKGEGIQDKRKDKWIPVLSFQYSVQSPRDAASGQASGKRQHKPITITKEWGPSSPLIFRALNTKEILGTVEFEFTKPGEKGEEFVFQKIRLTNARILSYGPHVGSQPKSSHEGKRYESLTLEFQEEFVTGGPAGQAGTIKKFGEWA